MRRTTRSPQGPRKAPTPPHRRLHLLINLKDKLAVMGKDCRALVVYDNFQFQENIKHQRIGDNATMKSVMTGKLIIGTDIPDGGLKQTLLDESVRLNSLDVFNA